MLAGSSFLTLGFIVLCFHALFLQGVFAKKENPICKPSSCGSIQIISSPFRLNTDPSNCGHRDYELLCENNRTILNLYSGKFYVEEIKYPNNTIRIVDSGLNRSNLSSSTTPRYSLTNHNFSSKASYALILPLRMPVVSFVNCTKAVNNSAYNFPIIPWNSSSSETNYSSTTFALVGVSKVGDVPASCNIIANVVTKLETTSQLLCNGSSMHNLQNELLTGVELCFIRFHCEHHCNKVKGRYCFVSDDCSYTCARIPGSLLGYSIQDSLLEVYVYGITSLGIFFIVIWKSLLCLTLVFNYVGSWQPVALLFIGARTLCGLPSMLAFLIYKWQRRHLSIDDTVEEFLQSQNNLMPIRYSYSQIRKMTKKFKDKLGEGGYGSVYKGKLRSGHLVAVKMLGKSKSNGQDFINEVATIGRIHHVNVVQLIGFCSEGSKRALVYEFMTNGSLDKFIFSERENSIPLSWERIYEIALGVGQGIKYLHEGCDMQILHFDIKPYNILLDENFIPKVSDFGLAKLYPVDHNTVSLTAARGTLGYIAPELIYKSIGGVSYKADVYSFGKLLMEMAGRRKNLNANADHTSQIYFPSWIYDQFKRGVDMELEEIVEAEKNIMKKMIIVASWCIQLKPADRPSMRKAVEMLEGDVESLRLPPELLLYPQNLSIGEQASVENSEESATLSCTSIDSMTIDVSVDPIIEEHNDSMVLASHGECIW